VCGGLARWRVLLLIAEFNKTLKFCTVAKPAQEMGKLKKMKIKRTFEQCVDSTAICTMGERLQGAHDITKL
jgi:hypothetical protein